MLYLPIARAIYSLGTFQRSFPLMTVLSKLFGIVTVLMFWLFLRKRLGVDSQLATLGAVLLAVSYGFWRYSNEAEVYTLAALTTVLLCGSLFVKDVSYKSSIIGGILAAVALMGHLVNFLLVCVALPIRSLLLKQFRSLCIYALVTSSIMLSTYYFIRRAGADVNVKNYQESFVASTIADKNEAISLKCIPKAIIGFGQTFYGCTSTNFGRSSKSVQQDIVYRWLSLAGSSWFRLRCVPLRRL